MSAGKSSGSGTQVTTQQLTPEQRDQISLQNQFFSGTIAPAYQQAVQGAKDIYNLSAGGVTNAGQNLASVGTQVQETAGSTGESALRTGITGLQSLYSPDYVQNQLNAAMIPAQQQYMTNLANQQAQFGGAGQLGSARSALAQTALAGQTQAAQQAAAAGVLKDIQSGRLAAGQSLAGIGQAGLGQALTGAQAQTSASLIPQDLYNKYAQVIFGTPQASYALGPIQGTSTTTSSDTSNLGLKLSDIRAKREITHLGRNARGHNIYRFKYLTEPTEYVGVMAQEIQSTIPSAVVMGTDGLLRVDYEKIGTPMMTYAEWSAQKEGI